MKCLTVVQQLPNSDWEDFVERHPAGNIFQTPEMFELHNSIPDHRGLLVAVINHQNEIQGVMSCCIISEPGIKKFFSRRSIIVGGPLIKDDDPQIADLLLSAYNKIAARMVIYTQFRNIAPLDALDGPLRNNGFVYEDHLTVIVDLTLPKEQLVGNINKKRLSGIRSAIRKGLQSAPIEDRQGLAKAIRLIQLTYERINLPAPPAALFYRAKEILGDHIRFFGTLYNGELIGVRICLKHKDLIYDWYAGSDPRFSSLRPNDLLPMECLLWGKQENGKIYDFGGAGKPDKPYGVRDFKLQYGGRLVNYGRYTRVHNKIMYKIGELGVRMMKKKAAAKKKFNDARK